MRAAVAERSRWERGLLHVVEAPIGYVAGEATAAVHYLNNRTALPTVTPPRMTERGVGNRPTLVQNVESLAYAALIARFGAAWYREAGGGPTRGTALVTIGGAVRRSGLLEIEYGTALGDVIDRAGGLTRPPRAVLLGGYFGAWSRVEEAWDLPLDPQVMATRGLSFGCGMIGVLGAGECAVTRIAEIAAFLAAASANQCGPCRFGLPAIAGAVRRLAANRAATDDHENVATWTNLVRGRGACRHPDGAAQQLASALDVFAGEFASHQAGRRCPAVRSPAQAA
jgi:NADH:ubiquinone oxidoreductase subunit F (NADH-binding)